MNKLFENEQMFEQINTKMSAATKSLVPDNFPRDLVLELYCECANKACQERISIAYDAYKTSKANPNTFVVKPKHYLPEFERIAKRTRHYWVIVKLIEKLDKQFEV